MTLRQALGAEVCRIRTSRGLTPAELAATAHISRSYLYEVEHGTKEPSSQILGARGRAAARQQERRKAMSWGKSKSSGKLPATAFRGRNTTTGKRQNYILRYECPACGDHYRSADGSDHNHKCRGGRDD